MRTLTLRELNRTLLARQMLLERKRVSTQRAVQRLVALQAQYAPSPYVALWARSAGFKKEQLTRALADGTLIKATSMRETLHVTTHAMYVDLVSVQIERLRARSVKLPVPPEELAARWPEDPVHDAAALARELLGVEDPWAVAFTLRALPFVRTAPVGEWPHTKPSPYVLHREPLPPPDDAAARVVRAYLAAYGPASRDDVRQFTSFQIRQIAPALENLSMYEDEHGRALFDLPRAPLSPKTTRGPVRFLPAFDSMILAHRDRSRIVPPEYVEAVFNKKNATTKNTFTVDGFVAGAWRADGTKIAIEPFAPLPRRVREDVERERDALARFYAS